MTAGLGYPGPVKNVPAASFPHAFLWWLP